MKQKLLALVLSSFFLIFSSNGFAATNYNDGVPILAEGSDATEEQEEAIQQGGKNWCSEKEEDDREQCVLDYFAGHNYEGEPSCD